MINLDGRFDIKARNIRTNKKFNSVTEIVRYVAQQQGKEDHATLKVFKGKSSLRHFQAMNEVRGEHRLNAAGIAGFLEHCN